MSLDNGGHPDPFDGEHLSEVALSMIADGEDALVPIAAHTHLETCDRCAVKLGELALLSVSVADAMQIATKSESFAPVSRSQRPVPVWAIAVGLVIALLGSGPALVALPAQLGGWLLAVPRALPSFLRSTVVVARALAEALADRGPVVPIAVACVMIIVGLLVARAAPRRMETA